MCPILQPRLCFDDRRMSPSCPLPVLSNTYPSTTFSLTAVEYPPPVATRLFRVNVAQHPASERNATNSRKHERALECPPPHVTVQGFHVRCKNFCGSFGAHVDTYSNSPGPPSICFSTTEILCGHCRQLVTARPNDLSCVQRRHPCTTVQVKNHRSNTPQPSRQNKKEAENYRSLHV